MVKTENLKSRDIYLERLAAFQDTEPVKVITGIRRCGKSSLLRLMINRLKEEGISADQIILLNFESFALRDMGARELYDYVKERVVSGRRMYLFFDEVERVLSWEDAIGSFRVDFDCDIYITGSNARLLASDYSTYLSGRYVEIRMLPLSFGEFISFNGFQLEEVKGLGGEMRKSVIDSEGKEYPLDDIFTLYMRLGGMPGISDIGLDTEKAMILLDGINSTVMVRDILDRDRMRGEKMITDQLLLRKIIAFLADNIGNMVSATAIANVLSDEGLIDRRKPSPHTVQSYIDALEKAYLFYPLPRVDCRGKGQLRTSMKYYIADIGLRNQMIGVRDSGRILENIVFLELMRRGYSLQCGRIGELEIDFIATKGDEKKYIQVTESMESEDVRERELLPLRKIRDNHEKLILALRPGIVSSFDGIKVLSVMNWLLEQSMIRQT